MEHPDEGQIRAFLDGEAGDAHPGLETHIRQCSQCSAIVQSQEEALMRLSEALAASDVAPPLVRSRQALLRARRKKAPWTMTRRNLPKAASIAILITAGAAAALPGSPLRDWIRGSPAGVQESGAPSPPSAEPAAALASGEDLGMVGASLPLKEGGMTIRILELAPGAEIRVQMVEGDQVGIYAGQGTRFRTEEHVMEATGAPGNLRVEVPRGMDGYEVVVEGQVYLRRMEGEVEILGPVGTRTREEVRFLPWHPSNPPDSPRE